METLFEKRRSTISWRNFPNVLEKVKEVCRESNLAIPESNVDRAHWIGKVYFGRIKNLNCQSIILFVILPSIMEYCCIGPKKSNRRKSAKLDLTKGGILLSRYHKITKIWTPSPLACTCSILVAPLWIFKTLHQTFLAYNIVKSNSGLETVHKFCFWDLAILRELINFKFSWEWKRVK